MRQFVFVAICTALLYAASVLIYVRKRHSIHSRLRIRASKLIFSAAGMALIALSLLPFNQPTAEGDVVTRNLDVYVVVDSSISMQAIDYDNKQARLDGVKNDFSKALKELDGSRFTLVSFHSRATLELPGMYDLEALDTTLQTIEVPDKYDARGTAFIPALKIVQERIKAAEANDRTKDMKRVVIIVSDGERVGEDASTDEYVQTIKKSIDSALVVSVGTKEGAIMKVPKIHYNEDGTTEDTFEYIEDPSSASHDETDKRPVDENGLPLAVSKADLEWLQSLAKSLGGTYSKLSSDPSLKNELKSIAKNTETKQSDAKKNTYSAANNFYWITSLVAIPIMLASHLKLPAITKRKGKEKEAVS